MTEVTEVEAPPATVTTAEVTDRRRPGRVENVSPVLIPILRSADPEASLEFDEVDQTAALRGLGFGLLLSAPIWVVIAYVGTWFLS
jgi:hypothetical protein